MSVSAICDVDSTSQRSAGIEFSSSDGIDQDQQAIFDTVSKVGEVRRTYSCLHVLSVTLPSWRNAEIQLFTALHAMK